MKWLNLTQDINFWIVALSLIGIVTYVTTKVVKAITHGDGMLVVMGLGMLAVIGVGGVLSLRIAHFISRSFGATRYIDKIETICSYIIYGAILFAIHKAEKSSRKKSDYLCELEESRIRLGNRLDDMAEKIADLNDDVTYWRGRAISAEEQLSDCVREGSGGD